MDRKLFLLFNHNITNSQEADARSSLKISQIVEPSEEIKNLWKRVPPDLPAINGYLGPLKSWLSEQAAEGDFLLVQGDFGATYLMVSFAFEKGLVPIYSTTERAVKEQLSDNGAVELSHTFRHRRFRLYGR